MLNALASAAVFTIHRPLIVTTMGAVAVLLGIALADAAHARQSEREAHPTTLKRAEAC